MAVEGAEEAAPALGGGIEALVVESKRSALKLKKPLME
jgi:hypothetical protein